MGLHFFKKYKQRFVVYLGINAYNSAKQVPVNTRGKRINSPHEGSLRELHDVVDFARQIGIVKAACSFV